MGTIARYSFFDDALHAGFFKIFLYNFTNVKHFGIVSAIFSR